MGDANPTLAKTANRFFEWWAELLCDLFDHAKSMGKIRADADSAGLSRLVISCIEGALLICKASKDTEAFRRTGEALKEILSALRIH